MKKEHYNRFYDLFRHLHEVVFTIHSNTTESNSISALEVRNSIQQILLETNDFENISLDEIMNELKQNFYNLSKENKESYIIDILLQWVEFEPYFDIKNERDNYWIDRMTVNTDTDFYKTAKDTIKKNERIFVLLKAPIFEKYLFYCYQKKQQFFSLLSDYCYLINIDFILLQNKVAMPPQSTESKDYSELLTALSEYISGINSKEFTSIISKHTFTPDTPKANWVGDKVDACYFCDYLKMSHKEWNKLFCFPDSRKLHGKYKDRLDKGSPIIEILKTHLDK